MAAQRLSGPEETLSVDDARDAIPSFEYACLTELLRNVSTAGPVAAANPLGEASC